MKLKSVFASEATIVMMSMGVDDIRARCPNITYGKRF